MNEITFTLSREELYRGLVAVAKTRMITKIFRILSMFLLASVVFITVATLKDGTFKVTSGYVITIILTLYGYFLPEISAKVQAPSIIKAQSPLVQPLKLAVHKTYYTITGSNFTNKLTYEKLHSAVETDEFFLLKTLEGSANIVPKRAFTAEQVTQFRSILSEIRGLKQTLQTP
jgi:hypothetical protein